MSRSGIGPSGVFQIACITLFLIAIGADWLIQGHVSKSFLVWLVSIYVGLILAGFHERLDTIRDNTQEIKEQNEKLTKRFDDAEKSLRDVERAVRYLNQ